MQMWSSSMATLRTVLGSWSWSVDFFSTPRTTHDFPRTPTCRQLMTQRFVATHGRCSTLHGLKGILDLEELDVSEFQLAAYMSIGREDGKSWSVSRAQRDQNAG